MFITFSKHAFVADGLWRVQSAALQEVRTEITAQYADRLSRAGFLKRLWIKMRIRCEINRRLKVLAPSDALYVCSRGR